jgi:hypothetical protein
MSKFANLLTLRRLVKKPHSRLYQKELTISYFKNTFQFNKKHLKMSFQLCKFTEEKTSRKMMIFPIRKLIEFFVLRSSIHLLYLTVKSLVKGNEIFLWILALGGPVLFLIQVLVSNAYLIIKPFLRSLVIPKSSYRKAFLAARKVS